MIKYKGVYNRHIIHIGKKKSKYQKENVLYVREEQWYAFWAHDPNIVGSNPAFNK